MRTTVASRLAKPLLWAAGVVTSSATSALVNVYAFGNVDHAYGASGSLLLLLLMAGFLFVPGFAGCLVGALVRSGSPSPVASFLAGVAFAFALGLFLAALGSLSPSHSQTAVPLTAAFLLGALSFAVAPANVA